MGPDVYAAFYGSTLRFLTSGHLPIQRYWVHKLKNIASKLPKKAYSSCLAEVKPSIRLKIKRLQQLYEKIISRNEIKMNIFILSVIIFFAILSQVLIGTVRLIVMVSDRRVLTMIMGFFEAGIALTIGITVISQAIKQGINFFVILSYSAGFSLGLLVGMLISEKISRDLLSINIMSKTRSSEIEAALRENGFGVTCYKGTGKDGDIMILNVFCRKNDLLKLEMLAIGLDKNVLEQAIHWKVFGEVFFTILKAEYD